VGRLDEDPGLGKAEVGPAGRAGGAADEAGRVVEVKMADDDVRHPAWVEAVGLVGERLEPVVAPQLLGQRITRPDVDHEQPAGGLDEKRPGGEADPVLGVRAHPFFPHDPGDGPEHRPAVEPEKALVAERELERSQSHHRRTLKGLSSARF